MTYSCRFYFLAFFLCPIQALFSQTPIFVSEQDSEIKIPYDLIEVFEDTSTTLTFEQINSSHYLNLFHNTINRAESSESAYWLKITFSGSALKQKAWFLEYRNPNTQYLDIYWPDNQGVYQQISVGHARKFTNRPIPHKNFVVELPNKFESLTVFARIKTGNRNLFSFRLKSSSFLMDYSINEYLLLGMFYGIMLIMALYNLLVYAFVRERLYLWYVLYVFSSILTCLSEDGLGFQFLWKDYFILNAYIDKIIGVLFLVFFMLYANSFIELSKRQPKFFRLIIAITGIAIISIILQGEFIYSTSLTTIFTVPISLVFVAACVSMYQGFKPARSFVLALSFIMVSIIILLMNKANSFTWNEFTNLQIVLLVYAFNIALIFEVFILSFVQVLKLQYERQQQEEILKVSENRFRGIFEASSDAIIVNDFKDARMVNVNGRTVDLFEYSKEELASVSIEELFVQADFLKETVFSQLKSEIPKGLYLFYEAKGIKKDGSIFDCEVSIASLEEVDKQYFVLAIKDVSKQKTTERNLENRLREIKESNEKLTRYSQSNSELQNFAYVASHDMRQPIRTIKGFSQLLARKLKKQNQLDSDVEEYLDFIISGSSNLESLIHDLLEHSKIDSMQDFVLENAAIEDVLKTVLLNLNKQIEETQTKIVYSALPALFIEKNRLVQLFQNIISNAIKFRRKEVICKIKIQATEMTDHWMFCITDNGIGIPEAKIESVFNIFTKLHGMTDYSGHGIGLATCKKIVEAHEGDIWLKSELNVGTTFYFTIKKELQVSMFSVGPTLI